MPISDFSIEPYSTAQKRAGVDAQLEQILFAASATKSFESDAAREAFADLWLWSYLTSSPGRAFVACDATGTPVGYVVGSFSDPARTARARELSYFIDFASLSAEFPAELHVNLDAAARGQGIGSRLVERFVGDARAAGMPGVHVVTGRAARNVPFYLRNGFTERGATQFRNVELVFLGRVLSP